MLEQLEISLSSFEREGIIKIWHRGNMRGGQRRLVEINKHLNSAHIILLLISRRFMALDSELNSQAEMAMQREEAGEACVIPVLLSPVANWKKTRHQCLIKLKVQQKKQTMKILMVGFL
ncbi:MAG TPA: TIR domain-containing protein [Coleofasciculaceae cyanobacterium]